jgi:hypothetical protein
MAEVQKETVEKRQAAEARQAEKQENKRIRPVFLVLTLLLLPVVVIWGRPDGDALVPVPVEVGLQETIYVTALALNAEFEETGEYPVELEEIGMDEEGLIYARDRNGYTLVAEEEGVRVQYRSGEDLEPFRAAFEALLPPYEERS